jgi:hypothetical protein
MAYSFKQQNPCQKCLKGATLRKRSNQNKVNSVEIFDRKIAEYNQYLNRTLDIGKVYPDEDGGLIIESEGKLENHVFNDHIYTEVYNMMLNASSKAPVYEMEVPKDLCKVNKDCQQCKDLIIESIIGDGNSAANLQPYLACLQGDEDARLDDLIADYEKYVKARLINKISHQLFSNKLKGFYTLKRECGSSISIEGNKSPQNVSITFPMVNDRFVKQSFLLASRLSELKIQSSQFTFPAIEDAKEIVNEEPYFFKKIEGHEGTDETKKLRFEIDANNFDNNQEVEFQLETTSQLESFSNVVSQKVESTLECNSEVVTNKVKESQNNGDEIKLNLENRIDGEQEIEMKIQEEEKLDEPLVINDSQSFSSNLTPVDIFAQKQPELYKEYSKIEPLLKKLEDLQRMYKEVDDVKYRKSLELLQITAELQSKMYFNIMKFNSGVIDLDSFSNLKKEFKKLEKKYLNLKKN